MADGGVAPEAEAILLKRGIVVIPDVLATAKRYKTSLRLSAYILALKRIAKVLKGGD